MFSCRSTHIGLILVNSPLAIKVYDTHSHRALSSGKHWEELSSPSTFTWVQIPLKHLRMVKWNSNPGGLKTSTIPLGDGGSSQYWRNILCFWNLKISMHWGCHPGTNKKKKGRSENKERMWDYGRRLRESTRKKMICLNAHWYAYTAMDLASKTINKVVGQTTHQVGEITLPAKAKKNNSSCFMKGKQLPRSGFAWMLLLCNLYTYRIIINNDWFYVS